MTTDTKPRLFDYDREPLGLLPESMKTTIQVNDQRAIATLHSARRWPLGANDKLGRAPSRFLRLLRALDRLLQ